MGRRDGFKFFVKELHLRPKSTLTEQEQMKHAK